MPRNPICEMIPRILRALVFLLSAFSGLALAQPAPEARRLEVLFFGAPLQAHPGHDPISRYRLLKKALGIEGINLTYSEDPEEVFLPENLKKFDAVLMYGNWDQHGKMPQDQLQALLDYVNGGGGFLPIHCASACYGGSPEFVHLVGARFVSHGTGVFTVKNVNSRHPIMQGYKGFTAWDESYVHDQQGDDRDILEVRDKEPWTWTRMQGKGRVFYTAAGHDERVWGQPAYQDLLKRAIYWTVGPEKYKFLLNLKLPKTTEQDVKLPNYLTHEMERKAQKPLPPADSVKLAQVPPGFEISLFACEPNILNPIFVNWDSRGRAYVIQTTDYPNNLHEGNIGNDKIILCEDTNRDGKADRFVTFADKLSIPTSLTFANGGVICTNGSQMLFLQDTNGDDKADVRKVLFEGFNMADTHAGVSNLHAMPDGWIYATVGYSGFNGEVGGQHYEFSTAVFRFRPDGSKLEVIQNTTNNTWGLGSNADGDLLGSTANGNPSFFTTAPRKIYRTANLPQPKTPRADDNPFFNPSSMDIRQVDLMGRYTAAAGHSFYTSQRFSTPWREHTAFVCEPTGKLVGVFQVMPEGAGYKSIQSPNNIFSSADAWTSPVCANVGPDGALWICDWYNLIIQHNPAPNKQAAGMDAPYGKGGAYDSPLREDKMGRIYRIYPKLTRDDPNPGLDPRKKDTLIPALASPNLFWRQSAEQLLLAAEDQSLIPSLKMVVGKDAEGATQAYGVLMNWGALDEELTQTALKSPVRGLRRLAIANAKPDELLKAYLSGDKLQIKDTRELAEALFRLVDAEENLSLAKALAAVLNDYKTEILKDETLHDAWLAACNYQADALAQVLGKQDLGGALHAMVKPILDRASGVVVAAPKVVEKKFKPDPEVLKRGQALFSQTCIACHGPDGKGVPGAFPPLDGSDWLVEDPSVPVKVVLSGLQGNITVAGQPFNSMMAPLGAMLNDQQLADVLTYVRQSWSNDLPAVTADQVAKIRSETASRTAPWTAQELGK
jgi:uncharacterized protein